MDDYRSVQDLKKLTYHQSRSASEDFETPQGKLRNVIAFFYDWTIIKYPQNASYWDHPQQSSKPKPAVILCRALRAPPAI